MKNPNPRKNTDCWEKIASECRNFPNFPENDPCLRVGVHILRKFKSLEFCPFFRISPTTSRDWLGNATKRPLGRKKTSRKCRTFFAFLFRNFGKNAPELGNSLPIDLTHFWAILGPFLRHAKPEIGPHQKSEKRRKKIASVVKHTSEKKKMKNEK